MISSYSSPFNWGHKALEDFWSAGPVYASEKADGSQISASSKGGLLSMRSHHQELNLDEPDKMFRLAVETFKDLAARGLLNPEYTYRGEAITSPKHNTLKYARIPKGGVILFDVDKGDQDYMLPDELKAEADRIGLECVPLLAVYTSRPTVEELDRLIDADSILGGSRMEGCVLKQYRLWGPDKKCLMAKHVATAFRENNSKDFRERNPKQGDIVLRLIDTYGTEARWNKAIQHLREQGILQDAPQDIGPLLKEINADVLKECEQEIKDALWKWCWPQVARGITRGFPEFYKERLVSGAFAD